MFNVIGNNIAIFTLAILLVFIVFLFGIVNNFYSNFKTHITNVYNSQGINTTMITNIDNEVLSANELVRTGINFIMVSVVVLTLFSSFTDRNNLSSYTTTFIISIILSSILIYVFHNLYNSIIDELSETTIFDFTGYTDFIATNFDTLIILNLIAFLASFIFAKKQ